MSDSSMGMVVTAKTKELLGQASPWIRFLAILGFVGLGFLVLVGAALAIWGGVAGEEFGVGYLGPVIGGFYVALAVVLYFPTRTLLRMAHRTKKYRESADPAELEQFALNVRSLAKFYGIASIVGLGIGAIGLVVGLVAMRLR